MKTNSFKLLPLLILLISMQSCSLTQKKEPLFYNIDDFKTVEKYDAHVHVFTANPYFVKFAKDKNFRLLSINFEGQDTHTPSLELQDSLAYVLEGISSGWFAFAASFIIDDWNNADWQTKTIDTLKQKLKKGAVAVKVYKTIGMRLKDTKGNFVFVDNPRFDSLFRFFNDNKIPVIAHIGEPKNCWLPIEKMTVKGDRSYYTENPAEHMFTHPDYPSYDTLIASRDRLLGKNKGMRFIGAHLGSLEWSVEELSKRLDLYPDMAVDMAARICHLQFQSLTNWQGVHDFIIKYQDRFIYGTDSWVDDSKDSTQVMKQAGEIWINDWKFFTSDENMKAPEFEGNFKGLHLPRTVIDKIYHTNAEYWFPALKKTRDESIKTTK